MSTSIWAWYGEAAKTAVGFFWKSGWSRRPSGYTISAMIQSFVPKARLTKYMGDPDAKSVGLSTIFGAASSSCSFAALAAARSLVAKGAHFVSAVAFMFASTNLVIELGILILIFLGPQYLAAEIVGGLLLIAISSLLIRWTYPSDWIEERDAIYRNIVDHGWSDERRAFVQHYDSEALDASHLIMPLVFFMSPTDPRMLSTLDAILRSPDRGGLVSNSLVYRYNVDETNDGLDGEEGTFNICTFWLVEALTRASEAEPSRLEDARLVFEQMLGYANHLGLFSEEISSAGELRGNFPQAFTHLALISAAYQIDKQLHTSG